MRNTASFGLRVVVLAAFAVQQLRAQAARYDVGRPATPREVRTADISVAPDGAGLPPGHGGVDEGRVVYRKSCAGCHGALGQGVSEYPAVVGGQGTLRTAAPLLTIGSYWPYATTIFDYIRRAMPYQQPGTLRPRDVYAVTAYLLFLNHIIPAHTDLNERTLPTVRMPNRDGFVEDPRPDLRASGRPRE